VAWFNRSFGPPFSHGGPIGFCTSLPAAIKRDHDSWSELA
jgi:hypothetical protein